MDSLGRILAFLFLSLLSLPSTHAQSLHAFNWRFGTSSVSTTFTECQTLPIEIQALNASTTDIGVAPYFMLSLEVGGITQVSPLGDGSTSLAWRVPHKRGAKVLMMVIDSAGQSGGFPVTFFDIAPGDTRCLPPPPGPNVPRITPNVTTTLTTCDAWGLTIKGGVKPYNVTLAAVGSPVITNVTMGPADDVFTFIDRANPNTNLIAGVVDSTGQWGFSTVDVKTAGSTNTDCIGLISTSKTSAQIAAQAAASASSSKKQKSLAIALGITFGLVLPLIAFCFWLWWRIRRGGFVFPGLKRLTTPTPWVPPSTDASPQMREARPDLTLDTSPAIVRIDNASSRPRSFTIEAPEHDSPGRSGSPTLADMVSTDLRTTNPRPFFVANRTPTASSDSHPASAVSLSAPLGSAARLLQTVSPQSTTPSTQLPVPVERAPATSNSTSPAATLSAAARYRKAMEAHAEARRFQQESATAGAGGSTFPQRSLSASAAPRRFPTRPVPRRGSTLPHEEVQRSYVIQHQDLAGIVEELPPPYMDTRQAAAVSPGGRRPLPQPHRPGDSMV